MSGALAFFGYFFLGEWPGARTSSFTKAACAGLPASAQTDITAYLHSR